MTLRIPPATENGMSRRIDAKITGVVGYLPPRVLLMRIACGEKQDDDCAARAKSILEEDANNFDALFQDGIFKLEKGDVGNYLGDVDFEKFAQMFGGYGEAVRDPKQIRPALERARDAVRSEGKVALVNVWIDPNEYAPGTMNQTMYK